MAHRGAAALPALVVLVASACAAPVRPASSPAAAPAWKPFTFSILEDYDKGDDLADVARDFDLFKELGVSTWRGSFGWDDYEPERGRYDFGWLHEFMKLAESRGITLRPYVGYTPDWAAGGTDKDGQAWNQPPADQSVWRAFVAALASEVRHHPNVRSLEIYNEENVSQWWEGTPSDYAATLASAAAPLRTLAPFDIIAGGLVFADLDWMESVCSNEQAARAFDVLPVHAYPETWTPADVTVENYLGAAFSGSFLAGADRACGRKRIWINETGFATIPGRSERDQAAWWARAIATFAGEPRVEHIGIYEIKDLRPDRPAIGDAPNYHLGLTREDRSPKLAFSTVRALVALLGAGTLAPADSSIAIDRKRAAAGELNHRVFVRADGDRVLVIWNRTTGDSVIARLGDAADRVVEYMLDGAAVERGTVASFDISLERGIPRIFHIRRSS